MAASSFITSIHSRSTTQRPDSATCPSSRRNSSTTSATNQQAHRPGLRAGISLASGWPYGGPNTPITQAAADIIQKKTFLHPGQTSVAIPALEHGESLIASFLGPAAVKDGPASAQSLLPTLPAGTTRRFTPQQTNLIHPLPSGLLGQVTLLRRARH